MYICAIIQGSGLDGASHIVRPVANEAKQGLFPLTFDWSMVAYNTNPLLSPHWAAANVFGGFAFFFWIVTPAIYYTNTWFTAYLPFCTAEVYDRFGAIYNATNVITGQSFDQAKYEAYSPPYLPAMFAFVRVPVAKRLFFSPLNSCWKPWLLVRVTDPVF